MPDSAHRQSAGFVAGVGYASLFGIAFFLTAHLGALLSVKPDLFTPFWLPGGLFLAVLLHARMRQWPLFLIAAMCGNLVFNFTTGKMLQVSLLFSLGNTLEALCSAYLLRRILGAVPSMDTVRDIVVFILVSALLSPCIGATIGALTLSSAPGSHEGLLTLWLNWWSSDALSVLIITPLALSVFRNRRAYSLRSLFPLSPLKLVAEKVAWCLVFLFSLWLIFINTPNDMVLFDYLFWPLLLWAALRFKITSVFLIHCILCFFAAWALSHGLSNFAQKYPAGMDPNLSLQFFLIILTSSGITVAAISTERRRSEENLRNKTEELDQYFTSSLDLLCIADTDGYFRRLNPQWKETLGYDLAELVGKRFLDLVHPDDLEGTLGAMSQLSSQKIVLNFTNRYRHINGSWRWIEWRSIPKGKLIYAVARDITDRIAVEKSLRESETRYRTIVDHINDAFYIHDFDGTFVDCNENACRMVGYSRDEIIGARLKKIDSAAESHLMPARMKKLLASGTLVFDGKHRRKDGSVIDINVSARIVSREGNGIVHCFVRDISHLKLAEVNMMKAEKLESLGHLAGGIAHDFNNLLAGIFGNIDLALGEAKSGNIKNATGFLARAMGVFERAKDLTQQLLTFSKGGAPARKPGDIGKTVRETVSFALTGSNINAAITIPDDLLTCEYDPHQIEQVIENMVINAKQAMSEGGRIHINAENCTIEPISVTRLQPGAYVKIIIRDEGIGIPQEFLQKIFDPFFSTKQTGSGLGLATSWSIIKRHNGHIDVESTPGKGTSFIIYLPASTEQPESSGRKSMPLKKGTGKVLVMDDEPYMRDYASSLLSSLGYSVSTSKDGAETIRIFTDARDRGKPFKVVILDLTIPGGMGGKEAAEKLRKLDPSAKLIASSGYADDPVMADPAGAGFAASISKPYRNDEIADLLARVLTA
ncbi:MAG: PAS domain S-box protein [Chitinispirillaceae bacterium]|nr:PAS domain S-box protein [Chitinispirillaceae bacterium]